MAGERRFGLDTRRETFPEFAPRARLFEPGEQEKSQFSFVDGKSLEIGSRRKEQNPRTGRRAGAVVVCS